MCMWMGKFLPALGPWLVLVGTLTIIAVNYNCNNNADDKDFVVNDAGDAEDKTAAGKLDG